MTTADDSATKIADGFAAILRIWLKPAEYAEMKRLNETDPVYAKGACASHNYCDANEAMAEAFKDAVGRYPYLSWDVEDDPSKEAQQQADFALWNTAWEIARARHIGAQA